jgi:hypothetical protein
VLAGCAGSKSKPALRTQVVRWSPFDAHGAIKPTLRVENVAAVGHCEGGPSSEVVGNLGYRCGFGNYVADPCWRDGARQTQYILCAVSPWATSIARIRVPHFMLADGVTFGAVPVYPWGIELTNGNHCILAQGAHSSLNGRGNKRVIDYYCGNNFVLLRDLRRGRPWRIGAARYDPKRNHFTPLGQVSVREAVFGGLPPAMARQHELATAAAEEAARIVRARTRGPVPAGRLGLFALRVRLALPFGDWANVQGFLGAKTWTVVLHRVGTRWSERDARRVCLHLPAKTRRQLWGGRECGSSLDP